MRYIDIDDNMDFISGSEDRQNQSGHEMTTTRHSHIHRFGDRRGYAAADYDEEIQLNPSPTSEEEAVNLYLNRHNRAATCWRQLLTLSTVLIIAQIVVFYHMVTTEGFASTSDNPMYGPSPQTLVYE